MVMVGLANAHYEGRGAGNGAMDVSRGRAGVLGERVAAAHRLLQ